MRAAKQKLIPTKDRRYRVNRSELVYGLNAYIDGRYLHLTFQETAQRVLCRHADGAQYITWQACDFRVYGADKMQKIVEECSARRFVEIYIGGESVKGKSVQPYAFFFVPYSTTRLQARDRIKKYMSDQAYFD